MIGTDLESVWGLLLLKHPGLSLDSFWSRQLLQPPAREGPCGAQALPVKSWESSASCSPVSLPRSGATTAGSTVPFLKNKKSESCVGADEERKALPSSEYIERKNI